MEVLLLVDETGSQDVNTAPVFVEVVLEDEVVVLAARDESLLLKYLAALFIPALNVELRAVLALTEVRVKAARARLFPDKDEPIVLRFQVSLYNFVDAVIKTLLVLDIVRLDS